MIRVDWISDSEAQDWLNGLDKEIRETREKLTRLQNRKTELERQLSEIEEITLDTETGEFRLTL